MAKNKEIEEKPAKKDSFDVAIKNLFGDGFMRVGPAPKKEKIGTGHFDLDFSLTYGYLPTDVDLSTVVGYDPKEQLGLSRGILVEISGLEGSGKSSLAYRVCGMAQKSGLKAVWFDSERSFQNSLAELNGVNLDELALTDCMAPEAKDDVELWGEDIMDRFILTLKHAKELNIGVMVLDSVASLIPKAIGSQDATADTMAVLARLMSKTVPKVCQYAAKNDVLVIFINQIRENLKITFGDTQTTPGGNTPRFLASVRLKVNKRFGDDSIVWSEGESGLEDDKKVVGRISGISIVKNRLGKPLLDNKGKSIVLPLPIFYEKYFLDSPEIAFDEARKLKLISVRTGVFSWRRDNDEVIKVQGRIPFMKHLVENDLIEEFINNVIDAHKENKSVAPPELSNVNFKVLKKKFAAQVKEKVLSTEELTQDDHEANKNSFINNTDIDLEEEIKPDKKSKKK